MIENEGNLEQLVDQLYYSLYDSKTKEEDIIQIVANTNMEQRINIANLFKNKYGNDLQIVLDQKLSGDFKLPVKFLFEHPYVSYCKLIKDACTKKKNDKGDRVIFEMLTINNINDLNIMNKIYPTLDEKNPTTMEQDISERFKKSNLKNCLLSILYTARNEDKNPNPEVAKEMANRLFNNRPEEWLKNPNLFKEIFLVPSPEYLVVMARQFKKISGQNFLEFIEKNFKKQDLVFLKELLYNTIYPHEMFAMKIFEAIDGLGTDEDLLSRCLATRKEIDMKEIRDIYPDINKAKNSMDADIIGDTSGNYQKLCLLLGGYNQPQ